MKTKRSKIIKQILLASSVLVMLITSCFGVFADASEIVPFLDIRENRPNTNYQGEIYFATDIHNYTWSAQISQKDTGVIGVVAEYDTNRITQPYDIIRTQFDYTGWDDNSRVNFSAGTGRIWRSEQSWSPYGYIGFTIRMNPWLVAGDAEPQGIVLDCFRTYGYTLDYPSQERYYLSYDEVVQVDNDGTHTAIRMNMFIDTNLSLGSTNFYLNTASGTLLIDSFTTDDIDPYVMQWGMFDPVSIDTDLSPIAIRNVQKYVVDNGYTEGYNDGFQAGMGDGYEIGYEDGFHDGEGYAYQEARDYWYGFGYERGYIDAAKNEGLIIDVPSVIDSVFAGVGSIFDGFDWNIFGISVAGLFTSIIVATIVLFIIKKVK